MDNGVDNKGDGARDDNGDNGGASEAAPCPLQPCYFDKWDLFADTWDCQYAMGFPVCIFKFSCPNETAIFKKLFFQNFGFPPSLFVCIFF